MCSARACGDSFARIFFCAAQAAKQQQPRAQKASVEPPQESKGLLAARLRSVREPADTSFGVSSRVSVGYGAKTGKAELALVLATFRRRPYAAPARASQIKDSERCAPLTAINIHLIELPSKCAHRCDCICDGSRPSAKGPADIQSARDSQREPPRRHRSRTAHQASRAKSLAQFERITAASVSPRRSNDAR